MKKTIILSENKPISGNFVWMMGGVQCFDSNAEFYKYKSSLWSIKRRKWIKGPKLPEEIGQNAYHTIGNFWVNICQGEYK